MHRYFIFKKINELDELDNQDLLTKDNCLSLSQHKVVQPRYKDLKMPFLTALDPYLIYKDICIPRSYIQNANNQIDIKINKLQQNRSNLSNKLQYLINDAREKYSSDIYPEIQNKTFINTLKYIYNHIKQGIYVKIVNGKVYQFTPILNLNYMNKYLTRNTSEMDMV